MRADYKGLVMRDLGSLFRHGTLPSGDRALLDRFVAGDGGRAFEALIARHGPMVLGVCRRLLASRHDADDAFQATFLVLARKAASIRDPDRLAPWLYGVARRVATKARARAGRHRHEPLVECCDRRAADASWSDLRPVLDAELGRLSVKHRDVLVLCLLEGASPEEAARRLGCPVGTVKSRLARGRQILRARLVGRGIAPAVVLAGLSTTGALASPAPAALIRATLEATAASAAATGVGDLTRGVTTKMLARSTVTAAALVGGIALAGMGALAWLSPSRAQEPGGAARPRVRAEQDRWQAQADNLKQVLIAFHNFEAATGRFPAAASYGSDGLPKLSWRVALLPYLGQADLYNQFRQDEAWDSPHNKGLAARMPAVFETPAAPAAAGQTRIRGFGGKGTMFEGAQGVGLADVHDGTSNTLMVAVAAEATPWTKPGELPFVAGQPLPALDDSDPRGFQVGMADGSVRSLPLHQVMLLPPLITRANGEVIQWPTVQGGEDAAAPRNVAAPRPTAPLVPGPAPAGAVMRGMSATAGGMAMPGMEMRVPTSPAVQALEQRLQRVEQKLERILRKIDAAFPDVDAAKRP